MAHFDLNISPTAFAARKVLANRRKPGRHCGLHEWLEIFQQARARLSGCITKSEQQNLASFYTSLRMLIIRKTSGARGLSATNLSASPDREAQ